MKPEDLESIEGELFDTLDLADQRYIVGQTTKYVTDMYTRTPTGTDMVLDYGIDWS